MPRSRARSEEHTSELSHANISTLSLHDALPILSSFTSSSSKRGALDPAGLVRAPTGEANARNGAHAKHARIANASNGISFAHAPRGSYRSRMTMNAPKPR